jgi:hypothetical protein
MAGKVAGSIKAAGSSEADDGVCQRLISESTFHCRVGRVSKGTHMLFLKNN